MSSATTSYADHTVDLYCTIYGNELERQTDVYTQNHMEHFEKVWVAGGGSTGGGEHGERNGIAADKEQQGPEMPEERVEDSANDILSDWPEIPDQGPSSMLWTCEVCEKQMSILFRTEHLAGEHPPKGKKTLRTRRSRKKAEGEGSMPTWQCELCDEEVNIFYTAEHIAGKKHVMKLKESGEYQYAPLSEGLVEQRAVYKPLEREEVLAGEGGGEEDWEPEENPRGEGYLDESAVYRPEVGEEGQDDLELDWNPGGGENLEEGAVYQPEEEDDWEFEDNTAGQHWGPEEPEQAQAPYAPAILQYQGYLPPSQPSYQSYSPKVTSSQPRSIPATSHNPQVPVHIQVETFYCGLCDIDYPMSEQKYHPNRTFECTICDRVFHVNSRAGHLAGKKHMKNAKAKGEMPKAAVPSAIIPQATIPRARPAMPKVEDSQKGLKFRCELCNKTMAMDSRASHLAGSKHKNKQQDLAAVQAARVAQQKTSNITQAGHEEVEAPSGPWYSMRGVFYCALCQISMGLDLRDAHLATTNHKEREAAKPKEQSLPSEPINSPIATPAWNQAAISATGKKEKHHCEICQRRISETHWTSHLSSRKHKANEAEKATNTLNTTRTTISQERGLGLQQWGPVWETGRQKEAENAFQDKQDNGEKFHCAPCGLTMNLNNRDCHLNGLKHSITAAKVAQEAATRSSGVGNSGPSAPPVAALSQLQSRADFHCKPCNLTLPMSSQEIESHLASRKHKRNELANASQQKSNAAPLARAVLKLQLAR